MAKDLSKASIKFVDDNKVRTEILNKYDEYGKEKINIWAMNIITDVLKYVKFDEDILQVIKEGINVNNQWRHGLAKMHDVRKVGFKIHALAREKNDLIEKTALRAIGQAISSGHMKEHAMIASDYYIKLIGMISNNDINLISIERKSQLNRL